MRKWISFAISLVVYLSAQAQAVSLESLLGEAMSNSPTIQKSQAMADEASWKKVENMQVFLPRLDGGINYLTNKRYMLVDINLGGGPISIPQIMPTTTYSLNAIVPIFDGFAGFNRYWASGYMEKAASHELDWSKFVLKRQITLLFYKALAATEMRKVADQNLKTLNDHLKDVQALKKNGIATNYEVLRVEVQVSEANSELLNAQDNEQMARYKLGEALGKETEERELSGEFPKFESINVDNLKSGDFSGRTDLQAIKERVSSYEDLDTAAGRHWFPKISAFGQYQYYNNINDKFSDYDNFREAYSVGLQLTWNFFEGMGSFARSHEAAAQAIQSEKTLKMAQIKAEQDFQLWKRKFNYNKSVYAARTADISRSQESMRLAKEGRKAGTRTSTEL
ncbi:MAG: TolC family protein, partial [Pseudobdellovibrio sp.]